MADMMRTLLPLALGLGLLSSCEPSESFPGDEWDRVAEMWEVDPAGALSALNDFKAPVEQLILLDKLMDQDTSGVVKRCNEMLMDSTRERCLQVLQRRHLWDGAPPDKAQRAEYMAELARSETVPRTAAGPSTFLLDPKTTSEWWPLTSTPSVTCDKPFQSTSCVFQESKLSVERIQPRDAAAICGLLPEGSIWRAECMFGTAEHAVTLGGPTGYRDATNFCLLAERFSERCLLHVVRILATQAPPADQLTPGSWENMNKSLQALTDTWQQRAPDFLKWELDRFWSAALFLSYRQAKVVTGNLLDHVPPEWHRHVRAAAAWRLMELAGKRDYSLEEWTGQLVEALGRREVVDRPAPAQETKSERRDNLSWAPDITWIRDKKKDGEVPATFYLGRSRRPFSEDPGIDVTLCVLESGARQPTDFNQLVRDAALHPDPLVRWAGSHLYQYAKREIRKPARGCADSSDCRTD
jgi:hypothetical protein